MPGFGNDLAVIHTQELENAESKFTTEYRATVGAECLSIPTAWQEQALSELVQKFPLEKETISLWQWKNRGIRSGFKR